MNYLFPPPQALVQVSPGLGDVVGRCLLYLSQLYMSEVKAFLHVLDTHSLNSTFLREYYFSIFVNFWWRRSQFRGVLLLLFCAFWMGPGLIFLRDKKAL